MSGCKRLFAVLVAVLLTSPLPGVAQDLVTQNVQLESGWNFTSLYVQPSDSSFGALFDGTQVSMVKNEVGDVYLPGEDIEQISTWKSDEGYQIYAEAATTLEVTGTEVRPGSTPIVLEEGGNIVPFLPSAAQTVEEALISIDESLVVVEDEGGNQYDPSASSSPLDSLRPSEAYKVYVDRPDTLRYPEVAKTLEDVLALTGMAVGSYVRVRGYHEPRDNGGGLFQVKNTACRTDGGTCFIFDEDLSAQQQVQTGDHLSGEFSLPETDLSWRSVELKYGSDANDVLTAINLAGHNGKSDTPGALNTKQGTIGGAGGHLYDQKRNWGGGDTYDFRIRYKYATSDRRLVRMNVTDAVSVAWWGARPVSEGWTESWVEASDLEHRPASDNTAEFNWATNRAQRLLQENSNLKTAYVDVPGMYYKLFRTFMPENVIYRGVGAERQVGNVTVKGGVKMPPGLAMWYDRANYLGQTWNRWERARQHSWGFTHGHFPMAEKVGFQNFDVHGNLAENMQVFDGSVTFDGDIDNYLQNGGRWTGWRTSKKGRETKGTGRGYIEGLRLVLNDTAIRQMGGNGINTADGSIVLDTDGYYAGATQRNHSMYGFAGPGTGEPSIAQNIRHSGFSWAVPIKLGTWKDHNFDQNTLNNLSRRGASAQWGTTYKNFTVKNLEQNTISGYNWSAIFNLEQENIDFDTYEVDFRGAPHGGSVFRPLFYGNKIENGTVYTGTTSGRLIDYQINNVRTFLNDEILEVRNLTINDGGNEFRLYGRQDDAATNTLFENVIINPDGVGGVSANQAVGGGMNTFSDAGVNGTLPGPKRQVFRSVEWNRTVGHLAEFSWGGGATGNPYPLDVFISDSKIENNQGGWSIRLGKKSWADAAGRADRIYMSNTTFNVPLSELQYQDQFHYALSPNPTVSRNTPAGDWVVEDGPQIRLRNCTTPNGHVSDSENNTFTSSASDEGNDFVLIPTSLLGRPFEINTTLTNSPSSISSITSVEVANSDGSLRPDDTQLEHDPYLKVNLDGTIGSGESVTIDWTARVTPLEQYSTTGLFISRPVPNKTFTSGNGPFTVDLRGVAASQETWTPPDYSASSSDTGVVTANVTASNHRSTDRFYTLELTEQGTGTTTITVNAEIPNVGTATTTFEITVE